MSAVSKSCCRRYLDGQDGNHALPVPLPVNRHMDIAGPARHNHTQTISLHLQAHLAHGRCDVAPFPQRFADAMQAVCSQDERVHCASLVVLCLWRF